MPEKLEEQLNFLEQLKKPDDIAETEPEIKMEPISLLAKKTLRAKARPHKIKDPLPGVRLSPHDKKYHWE